MLRWRRFICHAQLLVWPRTFEFYIWWSCDIAVTQLCVDGWWHGKSCAVIGDSSRSQGRSRSARESPARRLLCSGGPLVQCPSLPGLTTQHPRPTVREGRVSGMLWLISQPGKESLILSEREGRQVYPKQLAPSTGDSDICVAGTVS